MSLGRDGRAGFYFVLLLIVICIAVNCFMTSDTVVDGFMFK